MDRESVMDKKIVVFGTGQFGRKAVEYLRVLGISDKVIFCETNVKEKRIGEIPVVSLLELISGYADIGIVLIAIKDKKESERLRSYFSSVFIDRIPVIGISDFIRDNYGKLENDGDSHYCNLCNSYLDEFQPGSIAGDIELFKKHHIVGAGYRRNMYCPACKGDDRSRWVLYCLSNYTDIFSSHCNVLHFAPEDNISQRIQSNSYCDYYSGDILIERAMHKIDITNIQFKDGFFDYIILNHVMEHIVNESEAVREIIRVLKPSGTIIMSFPICLDMVTQEDENVISDNDRLQLYGQVDHVRLYGNDFLTRFKNYGLNIEVYSPVNCMANQDIEKYGFIRDDMLLMCKKAI